MNYQFKYTLETIEKIKALAELLGKTQVLATIREKRYSANSTSANSRIINYWFNKGILAETRESGQIWRKFSLIDLVFISIAQSLRKFGMGVDQIKNTRDTLFRNCGIVKPEFSWLEYALFAAAYFTNDGNEHILVSADGYASVMNHRDLEHNSDNLPKAYLYLNLNAVLDGVFKDIKIHQRKEPKFRNPVEQEVLTQMREYDPNTIHLDVIMGKDGVPDRIVTEKKFSNGEYADIHSKISNTNSGEVLIKTKGGKSYEIRTKETKKVR
ncbi:MAG: hypothetical protein J5714_02985 [Alphaproteobacteria bacterium]|nr:hypothetical protein [Alphaproteobacteria bacterium]